MSENLGRAVQVFCLIERVASLTELGAASEIPPRVVSPLSPRTDTDPDMPSTLSFSCTHTHPCLRCSTPLIIFLGRPCFCEHLLNMSRAGSLLPGSGRCLGRASGSRVARFRSVQPHTAMAVVGSELSGSIRLTLMRWSFLSVHRSGFRTKGASIAEWVSPRAIAASPHIAVAVGRRGEGFRLLTLSCFPVCRV